MKVKAAFKGEPIPSDKSILKKFVIISACLALYIFFVNLFNSTFKVPFFPLFAKCMRVNHEEANQNWQNYKLLLIIPFTFIIRTNIYFDFDEIPIVKPVKPPRLSSINNSQKSPPIFDERDESHLRTSIISGLFFATVMFAVMFSRSLDGGFIITIGIFFVVCLMKGPLIAMWTHHCLKQKKVQQKMDGLTLSAQAQYSQLENDVLNDIQNMNVL